MRDEEENPWKPSPEPNPWRVSSGSRRTPSFALNLIAAAPIVRDPLPALSVVWTIYCHTHMATGRCYVGQTIHSMEERWTAHKRKDDHLRNPLLNDAIQAHGPRAFSHRVLERVTTQSAANEAEKRWIATLGCVDPAGFNQTVGGAKRFHATQA